MCGIIGIATTLPLLPESIEKTINERMDLMHYRGPDAQSTWRHKDDNVFFGHLRLSILDPRPEGTQPMHLQTVNGEYSIVFNGEVYNYKEIREELVTLGYKFSTGTDTEVILTAFAAWGDECVSKFNGMFAIAIYNDKQKKISFFRDRVGIKPLYYTINDGTIAFASEVKAIRNLLADTTLNTAHVHTYMEHGYTNGAETMDKGILRLLPGYMATFDLGDGSFEVKNYWSLNRPLKNTPPKMTFENAVEHGRDLLEDAIRLRLRADVPLGVFLSGGLDSSAVVAMLSKQTDSQIKTFSVRYDIGEYGEEYDESVYAEQIARQFKTDHHTYTMTAEDFERYIPDFVSTMDEPVTEAAALSLHFVSELAKEHVTVVLSGEGSDELFAGYDLYQYMSKLETIRNCLTPVGTKIARAVANMIFPAGNKIRKYADLADKPFDERYRGISVYDGSYANILNSDFFKTFSAPTEYTRSIMEDTRGQDLVSRMLEFDTRTWLVDDLLIKADRMSMGSSLELRVPFLDYRVVEFAASLPTSYKIHKGEGKYLLKKMMEPMLPHNIIYREKRGFPTPLARMFMGPLRNYVQRVLVDKDPLVVRNGIFNHPAIKSLCEQHWAGTHDHHRILWQLLVLEEWFQQNYPEGVRLS
jgi:asparagine synthase (glutamine-hydrolysing)